MIVTVEPDAFPPRVKIETAAADVWRVEGTEQVRVRGVYAGGVVYDFEAPQDRVVTYDDGVDVSGPVVMPDVGVWLLAPVAPELSVPLTLERGAFSGWKRAADRVVTDVPGRRNAVAVDFTRKAAQGSLKAVTLDPEATAALAACLDVGGPMLLSFSERHWPAFGRVSWVSIGDVDDEPQFDQSGQQVWITTFEVSPIDRPELMRDTRVRIMDLVGSIGGLPGTLGDLGSV